ncbi:MAG: response regulator [Anaerolineae bacterium]|nr:MAG: response regulator [Anaerolineae bacterium]
MNTFTILLVEDNPLNRDMLVRRLQRRGFRTLEAEDGLQGLEMTRLHHPDLVLLDISIPEMDGYEVARQLKADPETAAIPIIALTAHALAEDRDKALAAGCDEYATKPVNFKALMEIIKHFLENQQSA